MIEEVKVILVDEDDNPIGTMGKMEAHEKGILHRAFSIFIFNYNGQMLLQQRAKSKYHSGGLWTNSCCSHPMPGEETEAAAHRRLREELGFDTALEKAFDFSYKYEFDNGLTEHEFDHVYAGCYNGPLLVDQREIMATCYKDVREIQYFIQRDPQKYSPWFRLAFPQMESWWNQSLYTE